MQAEMTEVALEILGRLEPKLEPNGFSAWNPMKSEAEKHEDYQWSG